MPNDHLTNLLVTRQLAQYPDAKLYNAASMLDEADRPKVPVRLVDNDWKRSRPATAWFDSAKPDAIHVSKNSPTFKSGNLPRLAATLAHESVHSNGEPNELPAYEKERSELLRLDPQNSSKRVRDIGALIEQFSKRQ